jgi:ribosome modulation factor
MSGKAVGRNPLELEGMAPSQIHKHFERLSCEAAERGEAELKDAHEDWLNGWMMAMEHAGKLEHLKEGIVITMTKDDELFLLRQRSEEEVADYDKGFECAQSGGQNDDTKSKAWQRGWAEAQE